MRLSDDEEGFDLTLDPLVPAGTTGSVVDVQDSIGITQFELKLKLLMHFLPSGQGLFLCLLREDFNRQAYTCPLEAPL